MVVLGPIGPWTADATCNKVSSPSLCADIAVTALIGVEFHLSQGGACKFSRLVMMVVMYKLL